ncbi:MAG: prepilin-type N-terminal cleavage/methylation domain-containing protein [Myxococcales bacterium]|nr:prepilin-type N-terminal cleavage/methylation domain-containing protein [Myxococcales bacterium]
MTLRRQARRAFTLFEMLVAVGLLGLLGALTFGVISSFFAIQRDTDALVEVNHMARVALNRITRDLSHAFLSLNQGIEERTKVVFIGERDRVVMAYMGNIPTQLGATETDQGVVEYHLGDTSEDREGRDLVRRFEPVIDDTPEAGGTELAIASGVQSLSFEYWDEVNFEWDDSWKADDPLSNTEPGYILPLRVKVRLELVDTTETEYVFETQTPVYITKPLLFGLPLSATAQQWKAGSQLDKATEQMKSGLQPTSIPNLLPGGNGTGGLQ